MKNIFVISMIGMLLSACSMESMILQESISFSAEDIVLVTDKNQSLSHQMPSSNLITYKLTQSAENGVSSLSSSGLLTYAPLSNFVGEERLKYVQVIDGNDSAEFLISVYVVESNQAPVLTNLTLVTNEDQSLNHTITATDPDSTLLIYNLVSNPSNGVVTVLSTGDMTYTPSLNYNGQDSFFVSVSDGIADPVIAEITINILPINDEPTSLNQVFSTNEDTLLNNQLTASDVENDTLSYSLVFGPLYGSLTLNPNGSFSYNPAGNYNGNDSFSFRVSDGQLDSTIYTATINISPTNDSPVVDNQSFSTLEDEVLSDTLFASDVDGDNLTYSVVTNSSNGSLTLNSNGSFSYSPNSNYNGLDSFTFRVNDGTTNSEIRTASITIVPVNDAPYFTTSTAISAGAETSETIQINLTAIDPENDSVYYYIVTNPSQGTASVNQSGVVSYTANSSYVGTDSLIVGCYDVQSLGCTINTNISINISQGNRVPVANNLSFETFKDIAINDSVSATDLDGDTLVYSLVGNVSQGSLTLNPNGSFTYTSTNNYVGSDSFTFRVSDGQAESNIATVSILVKNNNWLTGWSYRKKMIINSPVNTIQTNIPVAVKLDSSRINYSNLKADGSDIRFLDSNQNLLDYEIDTWNTSGNSLVWVKIPSLPANTTNFYIWMYYGNSSATDAQNKTGVWSNGYVGVWHLNETSGSVLDSTSNNNHGTVSGTLTRNVTTGPLGNSYSNASNTSCFIVPHSVSQALSSELTIEAYARRTTSNSQRWIVQKDLKNGSNYYTAYGLGDNSNTLYTSITDSSLNTSTYNISSSTFVNSTWQHVAVSYNDSQNKAVAFLNGSMKTENTSATRGLYSGSYWYSLNIMGDCSTQGFIGGADEIRLSNVARSEDWLRIQYLSSQDMLAIFGQEQIPSSIDPTNSHLLRITSTNHDGYVHIASNSLYANGWSNLANYAGFDAGSATLSYQRFTLPSAFTGSASHARLKLYGSAESGSIQWGNNNSFKISIEDSSNAPIVSSSTQNCLNSVTCIGDVKWETSANTLVWDHYNVNLSPNIASAFNALHQSKGNISNGSSVQLWVTKADTFSCSMSWCEAGWYDYTGKRDLSAILLLEW